MDQFVAFCARAGRSEPREENVDLSHDDIAQSAWLSAFEHMSKAGRALPPAATVAELATAYAPDAKLLSTVYHAAKRQAHRDRHGEAKCPNKRLILRYLDSLDREENVPSHRTDLSPPADQTTLGELVVDPGSVRPFLEVEDLDELVAFIGAQPEEHRRAITHFARVWLLQEAGYAIPNATRKRISRDRKATGLGLRLEPRNQSIAPAA